MTADRLLLAVLLALCALLAFAFSIPELPNSAGFVHPDFDTLRQGDPGAARSQPILWLGWAYGAVQVLLFTGLLALGARSKRGLRGLGLPLCLGGAAYLAVWTALVLAYSGYIGECGSSGEEAQALFLSLPLPTAWMIYGLWGVPVVFMALYTFGYSRWIFTDEDRRRFEALLAARRAEESGGND